MSSLVVCIWEVVWKSLSKGLIDIEINLSLSFFVRSVYRVRKTDDVAAWVSYGTSLIVLVCSWLSHDLEIWVYLSFHLPYQTNLMINLVKNEDEK